MVAMVCVPIGPADVAKLVLALTCHMIASFECVDERKALWTLAILQCLLVKLPLRLIALTSMR